MIITVCFLALGQIWPSSLAHSSHQLALDPLKAVPAAVQQAPVYLMNGGFGAAIPADQLYYQQQNAPLAIFGSPCAENITCAALPNSYCGSNRTCQCVHNFIEDPILPGTCKLAPGYNEPCATEETDCRQPFVCNASNMCDCRPGYLQEYFQCVKDCPTGQVPVNDGCMAARQLEEKCESNEQCIQSYAHCSHNKCQCIPGTNQLNGNCYPINQCPLGEAAKDKQGKVQTCAGDEEVCSKDFYCLHAEMGSQNGFCCPKIKMNCPIGQPLEGRNCTNCPWKTHHCFSYVIGTYTETMCCPNACAAGHSIQKDGKCYAKVAYQGHCMIDDQCYNVLGATCRKDKDGKSKCLCPEGNFKNYYGRCLKEASLGEACTTNEECRPGSNTLCSKGVCTCFNGYLPEPAKQRIAKSVSAQRCIAEPSCPTPAGLKPVESYTECEGGQTCKENEFCRRWWNEVNHTYSLCCPKPKITDYESMCKPFRMKLMAQPNKTDPVRCDVTASPQLFSAHDAVRNVSRSICPTGASCLFDPYSADQGICCKPDDTPIRGSLSQGPRPAPGGPPRRANATAGPAPAVTTRPTGQKALTTKTPVVTNTTVPSNTSSVEIDEEDVDSDGPPGQVPTAAPALTTRKSERVIPTGNQSRSPAPGLRANASIPVVRIRGFNNQQG